MSSHSTVDISLQGREYRVACAPEERDALLAAVALVETKMSEIASRTKGTGERLAVMTALNMAHELLSRKDEASGVASGSAAAAVAAVATNPADFDKSEIGRRIESMVARLDAAMAQRQASLI